MNYFQFSTLPVSFVVTVQQEQLVDCETFRLSIDSFCSQWNFLCLSVIYGLICVAEQFVAAMLCQRCQAIPIFFLSVLKLVSLKRAKGNELSAFCYSVKRTMHSIPKINMAIVWIRRFLFVQAEALSSSHKLQP